MLQAKEAGMKRIFTYVALGLLVAVLLLTACSPKPEEIIVASKRDTEGAVLAQLIILKLRAELKPDKYKVIDKTWMGSTEELREALINGDIDIYPEYTGNSAFFFDDIESDVWERAEDGWIPVELEKFDVDPKKYDSDNIAFAMNKILLSDHATLSDTATTIRMNDVVWLERAPANNSWAIVVNDDVAANLTLPHKGDGADNMTLDNISDLETYKDESDGRVLFYGSKEFFSGPLRSFKDKYGLSLDWNQKRIVSNPTYAEHLVANRGNKKETGDNYTVYAAMAYTTDGYLGKALGKDLRILEDPKEALPVYAPAPIIRLNIYEKLEEEYGEYCFETWLNPIFHSLNEKKLRELNDEIDFLGGNGYEVARSYLEDPSNEESLKGSLPEESLTDQLPTDYPTPDFFKPVYPEKEIEIVNNKITVEPKTFWQSEFYVDDDFMTKVRVAGWAKASGGAFNDIKILILNDVDFTNWENFHDVEVKDVVYKSDKITKAEIKRNITEPGSYHLVVCLSLIHI